MASAASTLLALSVLGLVRAQYGFSPAEELGNSANSSDVSSPLPLSQALDLQVAGYIFQYSFIGLVCGTFFFGVFALLVLISSWTLIRKGLDNPARRTMLVVTLTIFTSSACYWALSLTILLRDLRDVLVNHLDLSFADKFALTNNRVSRMYLGEVYLATINYSLSDAVVVWRAWSLWSGSTPWTKFKVFVVPISLLIGSIVSALLVGGWKVQALTNDTDQLEVMLNDTQIIGWSLSLGTNFVGTCLIAWRAWKYRQFVKENYGRANGRTRVEKIFAVLVESGFLYCLTQIFVVVSWFILLPNSSAWASDIFGSAAVQLAGIYPTIVIILAATQRTIKDDAGLNRRPTNGSTLGIESHMSFVLPPTATTATATGTGQPRTSFIQLRLGGVEAGERGKMTRTETGTGSGTSESGDQDKSKNEVV